MTPPLTIALEPMLLLLLTLSSRPRDETTSTWDFDSRFLSLFQQPLLPLLNRTTALPLLQPGLFCSASLRRSASSSSAAASAIPAKVREHCDSREAAAAKRACEYNQAREITGGARLSNFRSKLCSLIFSS